MSTMVALERRRLACLAVAISFAFAWPAAAEIALAPGDSAPALGGVTLPVKSRFDADWSASALTLANFWASWCEPCRREMPLLDNLYRKHAERGFLVIGACESGESDQAVEFLGQVPVSYPIIRADALVDPLWGGIGIKPTSFLIDRQGRIVRKYVGANPEQTDGLAADVEALLDGRPLPSQVLPKGSVLDPELEKQLKKVTETR